jgi:hypothetical protein
MEHRGIEYQIVQTACPTGWKWTVPLNEHRTKTGTSFSKGNAIFKAVSAIENALAVSSESAAIKNEVAAAIKASFLERTATLPPNCHDGPTRISMPVTLRRNDTDRWPFSGGRRDLPLLSKRKTLMRNVKMIGATALALAFALTSPAMARPGGGFHGGGMGGGFRGAASGAGFRGAQASVGGQNFAGRGGGRFAGGGYRQGYGRGLGFAGGLAVGSALGYGYGGYYGDDYADNGYYDNGYDGGQSYVVSGDDSGSGYCAQRYKSYDPASGTYLGYDGQRHPCE